jgi:hypothetical protein
MLDKYASALDSSSSEDEIMIAKLMSRIKPAAPQAGKNTKVGTFFRDLIEDSGSSSDDLDYKQINT